MPIVLGALGITSGSSSHRRTRRSEEHTSELQSRRDLVCRLLLEKKKKTTSSGRQCITAYSLRASIHSTLSSLFLPSHRAHRPLHSFPTRRSSDLQLAREGLEVAHLGRVLR